MRSRNATASASSVVSGCGSPSRSTTERYCRPFKRSETSRNGEHVDRVQDEGRAVDRDCLCGVCGRDGLRRCANRWSRVGGLCLWPRSTAHGHGRAGCVQPARDSPVPEDGLRVWPRNRGDLEQRPVRGTPQERLRARAHSHDRRVRGVHGLFPFPARRTGWNGQPLPVDDPRSCPFQREERDVRHRVTGREEDPAAGPTSARAPCAGNAWLAAAAGASNRLSG
jgi:hypothetical protein